jgi:hypothetical protein
MKLWLDDERPAPEGWVQAYTAEQAIHALECMRDAVRLPELWKGEDVIITHMSFDHDLADVHYEYFQAGRRWGKEDLRRKYFRERAQRELTGYDVLLWMAEHNVWPTEACYVHTHNSARADQMCGVINRYGPYKTEVRWTPYVAPTP